MNDLNPRQAKYLSLITEGHSKEEAKRLAGYADTTIPTQLEKSPNLRNALINAFEAKGITTDFIVEKAKAGLSAKKLVLASYEGKFTDERVIDDNETQHKYFRDVLEITGVINQNQEISVDIGLITMPESKQVEDWNK